MIHAETRLSSNPAVDLLEVIYTITIQDILAAIARRMGEESLTLLTEDLDLSGWMAAMGYWRRVSSRRGPEGGRQGDLILRAHTTLT